MPLLWWWQAQFFLTKAHEADEESSKMIVETRLVSSILAKWLLEPTDEVFSPLIFASYLHQIYFALIFASRSVKVINMKSFFYCIYWQGWRRTRNVAWLAWPWFKWGYKSIRVSSIFALWHSMWVFGCDMLWTLGRLQFFSYFHLLFFKNISLFPSAINYLKVIIDADKDASKVSRRRKRVRSFNF